MNKLLNLPILLAVLYSSVATFISSPLQIYTGNIDGGVLVFVFILLMLFFQKSGIKFPFELFLIILLWFSINILASIFMSAKPINERFVRYTITLIILPASTLILVGGAFWEKFEKIIYYLTQLSIPLYILNSLFSDFFDSLSTIFHPFTYSLLAYGNYWSAVVYTNSIFDASGGYFRNCGFMWEPGAFALMIILGIIIHWLLNGVRLDFHFAVYFFALLTTFSTSGYVALFLLISCRFIKRINVLNILLLSSIVILSYLYVYQLDFIGGEISMYKDSYDSDAYFYDAPHQTYKGNRFVGAYYDLIETFDYPFGYGLISRRDFEGGLEITGVSGLSNLLKMWGIPIFGYFLFLLWRFLKYLVEYRPASNTPPHVQFIMFISLLMMLFSNPIQRNILFYLMILTPILLVAKYKVVGKKL